MKKHRFCELTRLLQQTQSQLIQARVNYGLPNPLDGFCQENAYIVASLGGQTWDTKSPSDHGRYGHTVGVISTMGSNRAFVVDITQTPPIIGQVPDIRTESQTASTLKELFGFGGWVRRKN